MEISLSPTSTTSDLMGDEIAVVYEISVQTQSLQTVFQIFYLC